MYQKALVKDPICFEIFVPQMNHLKITFYSKHRREEMKEFDPLHRDK